MEIHQIRADSVHLERDLDEGELSVLIPYYWVKFALGKIDLKTHSTTQKKTRAPFTLVATLSNFFADSIKCWNQTFLNNIIVASTVLT